MGSLGRIKTVICIGVFAAVAPSLAGKPAPHGPQGIVSDWTHRRVLYPESSHHSLRAGISADPRWTHNWYLRHRETWWPDDHRGPRRSIQKTHRDWNVALGAANFTPIFDGSFTFSIGTQAGFGTLSAVSQGNGTYLATLGSVTVTGNNDIGTYPLFHGGPAVTTSPNGAFIYDNVLYPGTDPSIDVDGLLFVNGGGFEINIWGNGAGAYEFDDTGYVNDQKGAPFTLNLNSVSDPGGGQTFPAKYVFDVTAAPNCARDFVVMGIPALPVSGGQANIVGFNNLYTAPGGTGYCAGTGPSVMFAYASGTGQIPASVVLSTTGQQAAYVENLSGQSYFHVLTIGTTGTNGSGATAGVLPGASGGNNAVDRSVLLSPDGGATNQSSTTAAFVDYNDNVAYVTTYSMAGAGSGYLHKIANVFNSAAAPQIVWSVAINAAPSSPVFDQASNKIFFTDSKGRIDYVVDTASPSAVYGAVLASGTTSVNPVTLDVTNGMVYACFNSNGTNAIVVQAPTSMASSVSVAVGSANTTYTGPYGPEFNNAWYTGLGTPLMYVAGTGTGTLPTLYSVGFGGAVMNSTAGATTTPLATGAADASPLTEFYNPLLGRDYLFAGVTNNCVATTGGGTAGCVMSLDISGGFPLVNASTTALPAAGGPSGIVVDNESSLSEASSIYYVTKTGATLVHATQSGLN